MFLVGVGGAVPDYDDGNNHVRLGDIVVSTKAVDKPYLYLHCEHVEYDRRLDVYKFDVKRWTCRNDPLLSVVNKIKRAVENSSDSERPWDQYLEEASSKLKVEESNFHRPFINTDKLLYKNPDGTVVEVEHPAAGNHYTIGRTNVRFGTIAGGGNIAKDMKVRKIFAKLYGIKAYDTDTEDVLESLEGNRNESYLIIRGISDYGDGSRKEWQPYSAMAAAAYMKTLVMAL